MIRRTLEKLAAALIFIWHSAISYLSPGWIGLAYMCITGHSKGYSYDLGSEKDVSILFGIFMLLIWLLILVPSFVWLTKKLYRQSRILAFIPTAIFIVAFAVGVFVMEVNDFIAFFGV